MCSTFFYSILVAIAIGHGVLALPTATNPDSLRRSVSYPVREVLPISFGIGPVLNPPAESHAGFPYLGIGPVLGPFKAGAGGSDVPSNCPPGHDCADGTDLDGVQPVSVIGSSSSTYTAVPVETPVMIS